MIIPVILLIIVLALTAFSLVKTIKNAPIQKTGYYEGDKIVPSGKIAAIIILGVLGIATAFIQPFRLTRVDAGHVGIKVNLSGDDRGVSDYSYKTGWVVYSYWTETMYEFPTYQQHIEYGKTQIITKGGFSAEIEPSFNYSLVPDAVGDMFSNLRIPIEKVEQQWLKTAIIGSVIDVANRWPVDSIFNHREAFESSIIMECKKRTSNWFNISQLRTNITPPPALQQAIIEKTKAIQEAQAATQQVIVAEARAKQKIAVARGDSAQAVIAASGEAEAIRRKQITLSPMYIDYMKAQKWDGRMPTTILGSNSSALIGIK